MFGTVLIAACTVMQLYVFWRAATVPLVARRVPRRLLVGGGVLLWAVFAAGHWLGHGGTGRLSAALELISLTWMAALFLLFVALLAIDLFTGFGYFAPRLAPALRGWALLGGTLLSAVALVQGLRPPVVEGYEVRLAGLPAAMDGTVVAGISDLHLGSLLGAGWLAARVDQVLALHPDAIVLLGDIFEGHGAPESGLLPELSRLRARLGVWAVTGNHESHGRSNASVRLLESAGIEALHDRWVELGPGLVLAGVDDLTSLQRSGRGGDPISEALAGRPQGATILLSHTPWQADEAARLGAGLMLSGHTHGGQIWPFGYLVRMVYPLLGGRYDVDGMPVIVCQGTGTWGPRMRLWRPGEILRITLRSPAGEGGPPGRPAG
ncbi:MAG: metallophosphoesterase [Acidobacteriota bacterium]